MTFPHHLLLGALLLMTTSILTPCVAAAEPAARQPGTHYRVMSSNIWGDYFGNPPHERDQALASVLLRYAPDLIALQEVTPNWWTSRLFAALAADYAVADGGASDQRRTNYTPLLYRRSRFELLSQGVDFYHLKLDRSKGVTWAVLRDLESRRLVIAFSTHFWWKGTDESNYIRTVNAEKLAERLLELQRRYGDAPVLGGGDFNCTVASDALRLLKTRGFSSAQEVADEASPVCSHHGDPKRDDAGRYRGAPRPSDNVKARSIDHLLVSAASVRVLRETVILDQDALDASDHSPIFMDVALTTER